MDPDVAAVVTEPESAPVVGRGSDVVALFAVLWAFANLFHVWGPSGRATEVFSHVTTVGVLHALIGATAVVVLLNPRSVARLALLAALGPLTLWFEAPFLGSHWVVASFVDVSILLAVVAARGLDPAKVERAFAPAARCVLLGFYAFAAFSKLNSAFFNPTVSCGTYYFDELAGSLGLTVHTMSGGWWAHAVPIGTALIECSVPLLLVARRTRLAGVALGLVFHSVIALDQTHLFSDFSSVLNSLFTLFLPAAFATEVIRRYRGLSDRVREGARAALVVGAAALLVIQWYGNGRGLERIFDDGRAWAWVLLDGLLLVLVAGFVIRHAGEVADVRLRPRRAWLWIVPALVVLNGASPYLELRTAYAFNMYANLETADGSSNHFLVRRTLPLTDYQSDQVRILDTSDPGLALYAKYQFAIPFLQLRDYLSRHRDASLTFTRNGTMQHLDRASDDPSFVEPVPSWQAKLFAFRSIDETSPARCQPGFFPAL